ncbi:MAG: integrase, partial [Pseudomonadota bacterium]
MADTSQNEPQKHEKSRSAPAETSPINQIDQRHAEIALPPHIAPSGTLNHLVDAARDYARAATSQNTQKAYAADWKHFARWCRQKGADPLPPSPELIGLYLTDLATPASKT